MDSGASLYIPYFPRARSSVQLEHGPKFIVWVRVKIILLSNLAACLGSPGQVCKENQKRGAADRAARFPSTFLSDLV